MSLTTPQIQADFKGLRVMSFESRMSLETKNLIERHGGKAILVPSMREIPFELNQDAIEFGKKVMDGKVDALILLTGVGARFLMQVIEKFFDREAFLKQLAKITLVARGPKPVLALKEMGLKPNLTAPEPNTWREILAELDDKFPIQNKKVFVQEYGLPNQRFIAELKKRGAHVSRVPIYRWALPEDLSPLRCAVQDLCEGNADVVLFTNATQIYHLLQIAGEEGLEASLREAMNRVVVASIGPVASENLKDCNLPVDFEATDSKLGLFVNEAARLCPELLRQKQQKFQPVEIKNYPIQTWDAAPLQNSPFLQACRKEAAPYTPVWLMRQAGRYMKEYRDVRAKVKFLDLCKNPDLACEVTVTAQEKLGVDAAIIFSDILLILEPMQVGLEYSKGEGPCIHRPVRSAEDVERLRNFNAKEELSFVMEAIAKTRSALKPNIPLIGFAGAPFTVASYLIEGRGGSAYAQTKAFMHQNPQAWHALMQMICARTAEYLNAQVAAGAQSLQLFDSWVGCLSPDDYADYVLPHVQKLFAALPQNIPAIHFGTGTAGLLPLMKQAGGQVIGLDWRVSLGATWQQLGDVAVQGNLDPLALLSDIPTIRAKVKKILKEADHKPGHIFNLGHGILPQTPVDHVRALVDMVHELSIK